MPYDAIIIGGGPAGSSAAISLAQRGACVLLLEEKRMPRGKLCGEFITPECFPSLERFGVMDRMLAAGAQRLTRVSLNTSSGKSVQTHISAISSGAPWAMSLSRARFDQILIDRAREAGAECLEGFAVKCCLYENALPSGVEALSLADGKQVSFKARFIIDASGRNSRLMLGKRERVAGRRGSRLYALKAHLTGVEPVDASVEMFFFPEGYGGLARVEDDLVNLCFIVDERTLKTAGGDPARVIETSLMNNRLARERLRDARVAGKWYSAGPLTFGRRRLARNGILAIGDASGMIDPFTGTGIQIALRTGEMASEAICETLTLSSGASVESNAAVGGDAAVPPLSTAIAIGNGSRAGSIVDEVLARYAQRYESELDQRMKTAGLLRVAAFSPRTASLFAGVLTRAPRLAGFIFRATRSGNHSHDGPYDGSGQPAE
ncbi:MAG TPA: NAD(P)/FAD-dependent oxidoreductase [Blastocatellia bacterium]|nr:NAD(P)/FAD-dependent oxidoreductase [Blastocatellia bacterium]